MRVQVVAVYNNKNLDYTREINISHLIDVDVLEGPDDVNGKPLTMPYDLFYVAEPPPRVGEVVVTTPAAWVNRRAGGKTRGFGQ